MKKTQQDFIVQAENMGQNYSYNDPLLPGNWHLQGVNGVNRGANVVNVWGDYRGAGIVVGIIDDGVAYDHPDLAANYNTTLDYDARDLDNDAYPSDPTDGHGTSVAGVIGAALNNSTGGAGVAPEATLVGYRIGFGAGAEPQILDAFQRLNLLDIANNSWGYDGFLSDNFWSSTFAPIADALHTAVETGRSGLGTVVVFSAGNSRASGQDTNYHNFQNDRAIITVAATTNTGDIAGFSTPGASILIAAPGQGIPTTDRVGSLGFSTGDYATLSGTSFSAPIISGVAALMLDANQNLGWRDVQEILAATASQTGNASSWSFNGADNWNGGGMHTSHDFGFGLVNATAAVRVAESWHSASTSANEHVVGNVSSPNAVLADVGSYSSTLNLNPGLRIEHIEVDVIMAHSNIGQLQLQLTSPDGTQSLLFHNPGTSQDNIVFTFSSTRDWGELSGGDWTLTVTDNQSGAAGTLFNWAIRAYGEPVGDDTYIYTDEFSALAAADPSRLLLTDTDGSDNINTAAIASDTAVDLRPGQTSSIAGQALTIDAGSVIENVDSGDGNDSLIGNGQNNWLRTWRGNDTLDGGLGLDTLEGGTGNDSYVVNEPGDSVVELPGGGIDTVTSSISYTLPSQLENLTLTGNAMIDGTGNPSDNLMVGNGEFNQLYADNGNDTLDGGGGADVLIGGLGNDLYIVDNMSDTVDETLGSGNDTVQSPVDYSLPDSVEQLLLTGTTDISGTGNPSDNTLIGNTGANTLIGLGGNDILDGNLGMDTLVGGAGNDSYQADQSNDLIIEQTNEGLDAVTSTANYVLSDNIENLALSGAATDGTGNGSNNSLVGNSLDNHLDGLLGDDTLNGGIGNDLLDGGLGSDQLIGGVGNDTYRIDSATDTILENAAEGTDTVQTLLPTCTLLLNVENLSYLGTGNFFGTGNAAANILQGGAGDDSLDGAAGNDSLAGHEGNDTYWLDVAGDLVTEYVGEGVDTIRTALAIYTVPSEIENLVYTGTATFKGTGNSGNNQVTGGAGNDSLLGVAGNDSLMGGAGNDSLDGGLGGDSLVGGLGNDLYVVDSLSDFITENVSEGTDIVNSSVTWTLADNLENLTLTGTNDINGSGNTLNNALTGNAAANQLLGLGGNDNLNGGTGADTLAGGIGNDSYTVDNVGDMTIENISEGADTVNSSISWTLATELENLTLSGTSAINGTGNGLANTLVGNAAANQLVGLDGNDNLNGGVGADTLVGGIGNDVYTADNLNDVTTENLNEGTDTINSTLSWTLGVNFENLTMAGTAAIDGSGNATNNVITGNSAVNRLYGLDGNDSLNGGAGIDTLVGGNGNDTYTVDNSADSIVENLNEGIDLVNATVTYSLSPDVENLTLTGTTAVAGTGNNSDNVITGNAINNSLVGMDGSDSLNGGAGIDTLAGGIGNDLYTVDNSNDIVLENVGEGTDGVNSPVSFTLGANVENLNLTGSSAINGTGSNDSNSITGNSAVNTIIGNAGNDTINGAGGADSMLGGLGNDTFMVDNVLDRVSENVGEGTDTVNSSVTYSLALGQEIEMLNLTGSAAINANGNEFNNTLSGNAAANQLDGGVGADTLMGGDGNDTYIVDADTDVIKEAGTGTDWVKSSLVSLDLNNAVQFVNLGSVENITLLGTANINATGDGGNNLITGNTGNNVLTGGGGTDSLVGGGGNDTYVVNMTSTGALQDTVTANTGIDTLQVVGGYAGGLVTLVAASAIENYDISGTGTSLLNVTGNSMANNLTGNASNNIISDGGVGGLGDTLAGGQGNDTYTVNNATDNIIENTSEGVDLANAAVSYTLAAQVENLRLTGSLAINGTGNNMDNSLIGNAAANVLDGGLGADMLTGGAGNDIFTFHVGEAAGDSVLDFFGNGSLVGDTLQFLGYGSGATFTQVGMTDFWSINYNGGSFSEMIELLGITSLAANDFVFA